MSNIELETLEFWQDKKSEYEECLEEARSMEVPDDILIRVLQLNIEECEREINVRD